MCALPIAGIILAAGKGTRMKSDLPKALQPVCGLPMVEHVGRAMQSAGIARPIVVVGHVGEAVIGALGDRYDYVWQREQLGTGHAALMAKDLLTEFDGAVIIAPGDAPLLDADVFTKLVEAHTKAKAACTVATAEIAEPKGYGRIVRGEDGNVTGIVEEKDATPEQRKIREVNSAVYCFDSKALLEALPKIRNNNAQGEYYLPDVLSYLSGQGKTVTAVSFEDPGLLVGVNDRWQLALADKELRHRILKAHALRGVTLKDIDTIFIGPDVKIGVDSVIEPNVYLEGEVTIGAGCLIGPGTKLINSQIGNRTTILMSHVNSAEIGSDVWIGPFANLREGTRVKDGVKIGDFVEIKNSTLEPGAKLPHLSYIGDAQIGERTNVGAGTITCNYDGFSKSKTVLGADVFVGSNSTLVAPVTVGDRSMIAAGSVVTDDVAEDSGAFGRARQVTKEGWAAEWRRKRQSKAK